MNKKAIGGTVAGVLLTGGIITGIMSTEKVAPGYVGVVYSLNGGIQGDVLTQGLQFKAPWHKVTQYSVATEQGYLSADTREGSKDDDSFLIPTSDGKTVNVDLEYSYHFDVDSLPETFTRFKGQSGRIIEDTFMRGKLKTWAGEVSSKFSVLDIYGEKRTELNAQVLEYVREQFKPYGIVIDSISFSRIGLDEQTEKAIQERVNSQQQLEKEKIETQKAEEIAKRKIVEAEAEAEVMRVKAQAEAEANNLLSISLDEKILKQMEMEARLKHGWTTISGTSGVIVDGRE